jgi:hypothetical protein
MEHRADDPGEHGLVHVVKLRSFDVPRDVETGFGERYPINDTLMQFGQRVRPELKPGYHGQGDRLTHPMVSPNVIDIAGKTVVMGHAQIILARAGMQPIQQRERALAQPNRAHLPIAAHLKHLCVQH